MVNQTIEIELSQFNQLAVPDFVSQWFSADEIEAYSLKANPGSLAARYLIKREILAYTKGVCEGREISILNDSWGSPVLHCPTSVWQALESLGTPHIHFSISHTRLRAMVLIIFE